MIVYLLYKIGKLGVMDKLVGFFSPIFSSGQNGGRF